MSQRWTKYEPRLQEGKNLTIIAIGKTVAKAIKIANEIEKHEFEDGQISVEVINARFLKPLDRETIKSSILKTKNVITIEDGTVINGLATAIKELIVEENLEDVNLKTYAYPDKFIEHGSVEELEKRYKIDEETIVKDIMANWGQVRISHKWIKQTCPQLAKLTIGGNLTMDKKQILKEYKKQEDKMWL